METQEQGFLDSIWNWGISSWNWLVDSTAWLWGYIGNPWVITWLLSLALVVILFYYLSKKQPNRIRAFNNQNGHVDIARAALVDIIRSSSEQVDIEKKPGVVIRSIRGKLHISVKIKLLPSRRLTEVADVLQNHLIDVLKDGMGIRKLGNINVMVVGVRVKTGKEARAGLPLIGHKEPQEEFESPAISDEKTPETSEIGAVSRMDASTDDSFPFEEAATNSSDGEDVKKDAELKS